MHLNLKKINSVQAENHALKDKIKYLEEKLIELNETRSSSRDYPKKSSSKYVRFYFYKMKCL